VPYSFLMAKGLKRKGGCLGILGTLSKHELGNMGSSGGAHKRVPDRGKALRVGFVTINPRIKKGNKIKNYEMETHHSPFPYDQDGILNNKPKGCALFIPSERQGSNQS